MARHTFLRSLFFFVNVVDCELSLQSILCHGGRGKAYISKLKKNRLCFLFLRNVGKLDYLFFYFEAMREDGSRGKAYVFKKSFFFCKCSGL